MEEELRQLRAQLAEEQRRREEEQRRREEEQRRREEEQRRREKAERAAASAVNQDLTHFLEGCHRLSTKVKAITELSAATSGATTNPIHRLFPQRILPWPDFASHQHEFWSRSATTKSLWSERLYPSATNLEYVERLIDPIGSEDDLRFLERLTVESMVQTILDKIDTNHDVDESLRSHGSISFENQAAFRAEEATLSRAMQGLSVDDSGTLPPKNSRADQFCVVRSKDGIARPIVAIEYKAPHKLTIEEICMGLKSEIWPERDIIDIIDRADDDFGFLCKNLMAAVITQLFSYMIDKGVRYGYICTGEAFVFVRITDDPTMVYYSINIPNRDYLEDGGNQLERTAVAQVVAFIHQALQDKQPDQMWIAAARSKLRRWKVEFIDVLRKIPETLRKSRDASVYQPSPWALQTRWSPIRSPIGLRHRCERPETALQRENNDSDNDDGSGDEPSPTQGIQARSRAAAAAAAAHQAQASGRSEQPSGRSQRTQESFGRSTTAIEKRPYCTHQCLLGLSTGIALDPLCPNVAQHGQEHLPRTDFLRLLIDQLAVDRGQDADSCALYIHGARGALLKVCLTTHGYTLVAKGVETTSHKHLQNEAQIYDRLSLVQGRYVPVCCGLIDLRIPFCYDGVELKHLLLMSWAGKSLLALARNSADSQLRECCIDLSITALKAVHNQHVLHRDAMPRNIMYDEVAKTVLIVDFECSEQCSEQCSSQPRQILGEMSPNRKRNRVPRASETKRASPDNFRKELRCLEYHVRKALN